MITKQIFDVGDLDWLIDIPLIELDDEFTCFSPSDLGFSVEKRTKVLRVIYDSKETEKTYQLTPINEPIIFKKNLMLSEDEILEKLNNSERWYNVAKNEDVAYIYKKLLSYNSSLPIFEKRV